MKKTDMLLQMASVIYDAADNNKPFSDCTAIARKILKMQLDEGMLPPKLSGNYCLHSMRELCNCGKTTDSHQWD